MVKRRFIFLSLLLLFPCSLRAQQLLQYPERRDTSALYPDTAQIRDMIRTASALQTGFPDSAIRILRQTSELSAQSGFDAGLIRSLIVLSNVYVQKGDYNRALEILQSAVPHSMAPGQAAFLPTLYNNQASIYRTLGRYEQAARCYYKAIVLREKVPSSMSVGLIYSNLSTVLMQLGRSDQALYYLEKAEERSRREENPELAASILVHKGAFYAEQKDWERSRFYFQTALDAARKHPELPFAIELQHAALVNLGQLYQTMGQPEKALPYLREAIALNEEVNPYHRNTALTSIGQIYYQMKKYREAERYLSEAGEGASRLYLRNDLIESYKTLAGVYAVTGRPSRAYALQQEYIRLRDSFENREIIQNISRLETSYRTAEKDKSLMESQLRIARQDKDIERQKSWMLAIGAGALISMILLIGVYRNNRHKQRLQAEKILNLQKEQEIGKLKAMMKGEEQERARIARELHDGIGGMLAAVNINLGTIQQRHRGQAGIGDLDRIVAMLQDTASEVRKSAHNLMPDNLEKYGLTESLRLYIDQVNAGRQVCIDLQCYGLIDELDMSLSLHVYRMLQELIQNIVRHAHASHASVQIRLEARELLIVIEDNGKGFEHGAPGPGAGLGLKNVQERIKALDGRISIESGKGAGTIICVELDLRKYDPQSVLTDKR